LCFWSHAASPLNIVIYHKFIRRTGLLLALVVLLSLSAGWLMREEELDVKALIKGLAGEDVLFPEKVGPPPHYPSDTGVIAFNSYEVVPHIRGYAGPIRTLIALDSSGTILGVRIIQHRETENYVHYVLTRQYLDQYVGKRVTAPLQVGLDIDGISRATVSVKALARTIRESSRIVAGELFGIRVQGEGSGAAVDLKFVLYILFFSGTLGLYMATKRKKILLRYRETVLVLSIILIGFYVSTPFSILHILNILMLNYSTSLLWLAIVITISISLLLAGRFYCGWLCPFGALSELIGKIPLRKWRVSDEQDLKLRRIKYFLLFLILPLALATGRTDYATFEPYLTIFSFHGYALHWVFAILTVVMNLRVERFWCRYLCPVGGVLGLLTLKARGYKSSPACPMKNPENPHISECIRCNICYDRDDSKCSKG